MRRHHHQVVLWSGGAALAATLALAVPASAGPLGGDGSGSNNPDLLRGGYENTCPNSWICDAPVPAPARKTSTVQMPAAPPAQPLQIACGPDAPAAIAQPGCAPVVNQPARLHRPAAVEGPPDDGYAVSKFEADWSVTLRGAYQRDNEGERFSAEVAPEVSISRGTEVTQVDVAARARLVKEGGDVYRLSGGALEFDAAYLVNRDTGLGLDLRLEADQESPYQPGAATGVAEQPLVITGAGGVTLQRRFGRFGLELGADAAREIYGTTRLTSGAVTDNSYRNTVSGGGRVRVLYEATPALDVFAEGSADRNVYDAVSPGLGVNLNSWTYAVRAGVSGDWNEVVVMEVSGGYGLRRFDSSLLNDAPTALVAAELTYRPNERVEWAALFGTDISAPEASTGAAARIDHTASLSALYYVNDRIGVRGNIGGEWTRYSDTAETRTVYSAGVGADYTVNKQTTVSADYSYRITEATANPREDSHRVSVGLTYSR